MKNLVVIGGPTASGKTTLGVEIASLYNGEIISCDSRQVYRGMDIGTGKDLSEYHSAKGCVPYHLIDIADPVERYTVYSYQRDFYRVYSEIIARGHLPVVVGGTGLYLEAVLRDYRISPVLENPDLRATLMLRDKASLAKELENLDVQRFHATDLTSKKRIVRSIEVALAAAGPSNNPSVQETSRPLLDPLVIGVQGDRGMLRERIRVRLEKRFEQGMVDEVRRLLDSGIPKERFEMFGLEYKHISRYVKGEVDFDAMKQELFTAICRFAKRQVTWFRGMERRGVAIHWVKQGNLEEAVKVIGRYGLVKQS
jgi:tRNA dimethylallyltransferase